MHKLHNYFLINFLSLFIFTLVISSMISYFTIERIDLEHYEEKLKDIVETVEIMLCSDQDLDHIASSVALKTKTRITIIDNDGNVKAESDKDKSLMENHKLRDEILDAREKAYGTSKRYSKTIKKDYLYLAKMATFADKPIFIRASISITKVKSNFLQIWYQIVAAFGISIIIGLIFTYKMSQRVQKEVEMTGNFVDELSNKNYHASIPLSKISEFFLINENLKKLAKKLAKREKQKRKYTAKLRLINKQRSDLISAISHEFKNPIAAIMGYAQTITEDKEINPQIRDKFLDKIYKNSKKISSMIDRLTMSVKFENNEIKPHFAQTDLVHIIQDVRNLINGNLGERKICLELPQSCIVSVDRSMMENVIYNLVDNAIKYSEDDITITLIDKTLFVKDEGIGISEEDLKHIKSKFYRVDEYSWDNSMGLGLALVEHILNLHKSTLDVESTLGKGSTFSFTLV